MIGKLLIANRGEIAERIIRTARNMGIATVAVYSQADQQARYVGQADEAVAIGGPRPQESYLDISTILRAAETVGADSIHPGYGFLAENSEFARRCAEEGVTFVGPPAEAIAAMGSKIQARSIMQEAGVPVVPGSNTLDEADQEAAGAEVGFPLFVKASAGGGGTGMRLVEKPEFLAEAVVSARREAQAAFGNGTVYLERDLAPVRHMEVQVIGDAHGSLVALFERDCTIQRRHQKVIEEAPAPGIDDELRGQLVSAALDAAKAIGYVSAGTVEFLVGEGEFYFLEMNTRLQVEHPVTELVTGLDLVRLQLLVAEGQALPPEVHTASLDGHAVEARLYAEDPLNDYLPSAGSFSVLDIAQPPGVRVDSGVAAGSEVSAYYDPLLAKVIAHAPTRSEALRTLAGILERARLHGPATNRDQLVRALRHPDVLAGHADTRLLDRSPELALPLVDQEGEQIHAVAAALARQAARREMAPVLDSIPSGWRNNPSGPQVATMVGRTETEVGYRFDRDGVLIEVNGAARPDIELASSSANAVTLRVAGVDRTFVVASEDDVAWVDSPVGSTRFDVVPRLPVLGREEAPGSLRAPMPGTVISVKASEGQRVEAGHVLVTIDAMKMEHAVRAPEGGLVAEVLVAEGDQVEAGQILAVITPD